MNVNGVNKNLIDQNSVVNTTQALFSALQRKTVDYSNSTLQGFNRKTLGVDLYSTKTDINTQREIAIANSGALFAPMNLSSVRALNSIAAQQMYAANVQDAVGGKMTIEANVPENFDLNKVEDIQNEINVFETDKDKKGANPFTFGKYLFNSEEEQA